MKRLSIIVPMYNVEPYVERCLRSLENQDITQEDYEIICINDGSPDNSKEIVIKLQKEFDNILLIDQENQGVSRARNNGMDKATGKYLLFIDPDDFVDENSFGRVLDNADKYNIEVSYLGFTFHREDGSVHRQVLNSEYSLKVLNGNQIYYMARGDGRTDPDRMWAVLFNTKFMNKNGLRYLANVPYLEDGELIARVLCLANKCIFDGNSFYQRTTRLGSATNSKLFYTQGATHGFVLSAINLKKFQDQANLTEAQRYFINQPICKFVFLITNAATYKPYYKNYKRIKKILEWNGLSRIDKDGVSKPYSYYVAIYNFSLLIFVFLSKLKNIKGMYRVFRWFKI
ncbi:glycosyltransferase family 2 protein [Saccharicrinis sp. GN24d3]|uniref:glycosyltransferase family 2 protein n=1 Tax=Saccharicrinis sp. GN24d3 TaxID=3458416 RepID=UPI0040354196